jgi:hypothetical protein
MAFEIRTQKVSERWPFKSRTVRLSDVYCTYILSDNGTISKVNTHIRSESKHRTERMINYFKLIYLSKWGVKISPLCMKQACHASPVTITDVPVYSEIEICEVLGNLKSYLSTFTGLVFICAGSTSSGTIQHSVLIVNLIMNHANLYSWSVYQVWKTDVW